MSRVTYIRALQPSRLEPSPSLITRKDKTIWALALYSRLRYKAGDLPPSQMLKLGLIGGMEEGLFGWYIE
jgi:hypothetical protein